MLLSKRELRKKRREKTYKSTPMTTNYMKNCSTSLVIRDMHIKSTEITIRTPKNGKMKTKQNKPTDIIKCCQRCSNVNSLAQIKEM